VALAQAVEVRRGAVRERGGVAGAGAGEDGGAVAAADGERGLRDERVDAAVDAVKPARRDPVLHSAPTEAERGELLEREDEVALDGHVGELGI
jgi:hypothetical protein